MDTESLLKSLKDQNEKGSRASERSGRFEIPPKAKEIANIQQSLFFIFTVFANHVNFSNI